MANEVLLKFATRNLKKAREIAFQIGRRMLLATKAGSKARAFLEKTIQANTDLIEKSKQRFSALQKRADRIVGPRESKQLLSFRENAVRGAERGLAGISAVRALADGNLLAGGSFLASLLGGPAGVVAQAVTLTIEIVKPLIEKEAERERVKFNAKLDADLTELRDKIDVERRLREDPEFAEAQSRQFGRELRFRDAALARAKLDGKPFTSRTTRDPRGGFGDF